jgi:hypothetical protein
MENPETWGPLEHAIDEALYQAEKGQRAGHYHLSVVRQIADALREKGLVE